MRGPGFVELAQALREDPGLVVERYCSPEQAYTDSRGRHFCLNPMRPDRSVGSFYIWLRGAGQGRWHDFATGQSGDLMDMIEACDTCDAFGAAQTAKQLLRIMEMTPTRRLEFERARKAREARRQAALEDDRHQLEKRERWGAGLRRCQDDYRAPRSAHPPLPHLGNWQ